MSFQEIYVELKKIRKDVECIKNILLQLIICDSISSPEEEKLVEQAKEEIEKNNFSDFIDVDEL
ncbi:MAG: hypothetical protein DRO67_10100 [Candidatus Asgardarchaeum californiense]|nr:MAG: hypothetical protein DRO67_10100 [Candidatus Asgardarchaeum californiense]